MTDKIFFRADGIPYYCWRVCRNKTHPYSGLPDIRFCNYNENNSFRLDNILDEDLLISMKEIECPYYKEQIDLILKKNQPLSLKIRQK
jgi:hypothetical protein